MSGKTNISWTDFSWNPVVGCTRVSAGCDSCYAYQLHDQRHEAWKAGRFPDAPAQYHEPFSKVQLMPQRLEDPLRWRKPRRVFVNSVSDLFHADVPTEFIDQVFCVMGAAKRHTFQVLTKRPRRMERYLNDPETKYRVWGAARYIIEQRLHRNMYDAIPVAKPGAGPEWCYPAVWPLPNVWIGTSVENQEAAFRIDWLVKTPAVVRFISAEPLLGPLDLSPWFPVRDCRPTYEYFRLFTGNADSRPITIKEGVDWVIAGGESGPDFRPLDLDWVRSLRDQCVEASVPFFFKQGSGRLPGKNRELDGRTWEEFPEAA